MKKYKETTQGTPSRASHVPSNTRRVHARPSDIRPKQRVLSGNGWTAAVTLDDASALELLQTWSLPDNDETDTGEESGSLCLRSPPAIT